MESSLGFNWEEARREVTVVIPTLNEAEAIGLVIDEVLGIGVPRENILVVDGGSSDGTVEIARGRGVRVVFQEGRGKTDALRTATRHIATPYVLVMDGDYTYPAKYIPELLREAYKSGVDLVIGVRANRARVYGFLFELGNRVLTFMFNILFGTRLRDVLSGMYLVKKRVLDEIFFASKGFGIESEIIAHVVSTGGRVGEVNIEYRERLGRKKLGIRHGFQILWTIMHMAWSYSPVFTMFAVASLLIIPGLALGAWVFLRYALYGILHSIRGLAAIALTTAGFNALLLAILTLYLKRLEIRTLRMVRELEKTLMEREKRLVTSVS